MMVMEETEVKAAEPARMFVLKESDPADAPIDVDGRTFQVLYAYNSMDPEKKRRAYTCFFGAREGAPSGRLRIHRSEPEPELEDGFMLLNGTSPIGMTKRTHTGSESTSYIVWAGPSAEFVIVLSGEVKVWNCPTLDDCPTAPTTAPGPHYRVVKGGQFVRLTGNPDAQWTIAAPAPIPAPSQADTFDIRRKCDYVLTAAGDRGMHRRGQ